MKTRERGFSLIELLIVVAIILIIATIAIPSLLRSRQAANESAAVANLRTINTAQVTYLSGSGGTYGNLTDLQTAGLIDTSFSNAVGKSGYTYSMAVAIGEYTAMATPTATNSGRYGYYTTPDGVVRWQTATSATCAPCFPASMGGNPVQ